MCVKTGGWKHTQSIKRQWNNGINLWNFLNLNNPNAQSAEVESAVQVRLLKCKYVTKPCRVQNVRLHI